jgi:hypothetical protein
LLTVLKQITSSGRTIRELFRQRVRSQYLLFEKTHLLLLTIANIFTVHAFAMNSWLTYKIEKSHG